MAKREDSIIFPIRNIRINLPDDLTSYTAEDFVNDNKALRRWKYPNYETEQWELVFPEFEKDARQILYIVLVLWWGSPLAEFDYDTRCKEGATLLGWYTGKEDVRDILQWRAIGMKENVHRFTEAQSLRAWDMHNRQWHMQTVMQETLLDMIGKPDEEFDQKHVVTWKQSLSADLPILMENQKNLCEKIKHTRKDVAKAFTEKDLKAEASKSSDSGNFRI